MPLEVCGSCHEGGMSFMNTRIPKEFKVEGGSYHVEIDVI